MGIEPEQIAEEHVSNEAAPSADHTAEQEDHSAGDGKSLVVYFSRTGEQYTVGVIDKGNTAIVAEMIADETGADLFELVPADDHYPMTYAELTDVAKREQNEGARPEYAGEVPDLSAYDMIFIGAPVWWGDWPMICYTFFENNADALSGKTLVPFSTHEGSGLSGFDKKLGVACPDAEIGKGLAVRGNDCQNRQDSVGEDVSDWLGEIGY
ncbi:MAG: flavodoxin [Clostridia bacterium]|nr:flavodoxin [Clostridia bacterium]